MTSEQRVKIALSGGKPDRVPIVPIFDWGYVMRSNGHDLRCFLTADSRQRIEYIEQGFLKHDVDAYLVHTGVNDDFANSHILDKKADVWTVTDKKIGESYALLPDGSRLDSDGSITPCGDSKSKDGVKTIEDVKNIDLSICQKEAYEKSMVHAPLKYLSSKYPDKHFIFQISSPFVRAINACGGFEQGLIMMAAEREIFQSIMERFTEREKALIDYGKESGGKSILLTSYYTGADTISPKDYADIVFPAELELCLQAKKQGLKVLYWFLGDLMPVLDKAVGMPLDALILEQGRKGYDIDPVKIRNKVGGSLCISSFGYELDYCKNNKENLKAEFIRQFEGAGKDGAFAAGTPIMPPDADPNAVDYYFGIAKEYGKY